MFELFDIHLEGDPSYDVHSHLIHDFGENYGNHQPVDLAAHQLLDHHAATLDEVDCHYPVDDLYSHSSHAGAHSEHDFANAHLHGPTTGATHEEVNLHSGHEMGGVVDWWKDAFHDFWHWISPEHVVTIGGDPDAEKHYWHVQEGVNSCAVAAQTGVRESVLHRHFDEAEMARIAHEKGWYSPQEGTPQKDVGKLLEAYGIPVERHTGFTLTELYDAVQHHQKVIVGLNANEIWYPKHGSDGKPLQQLPIGHAVWVTGFSMNPRFPRFASQSNVIEIR